MAERCETSEGGGSKDNRSAHGEQPEIATGIAATRRGTTTAAEGNYPRKAATGGDAQSGAGVTGTETRIDSIKGGRKGNGDETNIQTGGTSMFAVVGGESAIQGHGAAVHRHDQLPEGEPCIHGGTGANGTGGFECGACGESQIDGRIQQCEGGEPGADPTGGDLSKGLYCGARCAPKDGRGEG